MERETLCALIGKICRAWRCAPKIPAAPNKDGSARFLNEGPGGLSRLTPVWRVACNPQDLQLSIFLHPGRQIHLHYNFTLSLNKFSEEALPPESTVQEICCNYVFVPSTAIVESTVPGAVP